MARISLRENLKALERFAISGIGEGMLLGSPAIIMPRPPVIKARNFCLRSFGRQIVTKRYVYGDLNTSINSRNLFHASIRPFSTISKLDTSGVSNFVMDDDVDGENGNGSFYFDTHKLVTSLQCRGFSLDQSEAITNSLTKVVGRGAAALSKYMVSRNELAQLEVRMNGTVEALRKDMVILEKSEFLMLKHENETLKSEVTQLSRLLKDELLKLKSGLTLDLSLEKGRTKEESAVHEQKIKDAHNRIETEVARVRMEMEAQKLDLIKYLVGTFFSIVTVLIGWWRFVKS
eukprot:gene4047-4598_t